MNIGDRVKTPLGEGAVQNVTRTWADKVIETEFRPDGVLKNGRIVLRRDGIPTLFMASSISYQTRVHNVTVGRMRFDDDWENAPNVGSLDYESLLDNFVDMTRTALDYREAFDSALAVIEELAGEIRDMELMWPKEPPCPGPDWYWVRGHWRSHKNGGLESLAVCQWEPERWSEAVKGEE